MFTYTIRRLLQLIPVLWGIATIIFFMMAVVPGDPARLLAGQSADPQVVAKIRQERGLDKPLLQQYLIYLASLAKGDFGDSMRENIPVTTILFDRFPATARLAVASIIVAVIIGVIMGLLAAVKQNTWVDGIIMALAMLGVSTPVFWLGLMLILVFASVRPDGTAVVFAILPVSGYGDGGLQHLVLPAMALSAISIGYIARMTRSSVLEVLRQDFMRTAHAKGLSKSVVVVKHGLRNALIPVVTIVGLNFAGLLGGAVATEYVFSWPGLGKKIVDAIIQRDVYLVEGGVMFLAFFFVIMNLLVDLSYAFLDPRIKYQ